MRASVTILGRPHQLDPEPVNMRMEFVAEHLRTGNPRPLYVCLEPGDATRYEMILQLTYGIIKDEFGGRGIPSWGVERELLVVRLHGGYAIGSATIGKNYCGPYDFEEIGAPNEHTWEIFSWWFKHLFAAIG